jgi:hypothetical protein
MFLTFTEYQSMGGRLKQVDFTQAEFIARQKINEMTYNRIQEAAESVKMCVFGLIERGYLGRLDGGDRTSESNNGTSFSYEAREGRAEEFIRACLSDTPNLFYAGF